MARFEDIKSIINTYIKPNGKEEITGEVLQNVLRAMMEAVDIVVDEVVAAFPQISGSEFVDVLENKVSLLLDPQGHLGNTGRGLGVVMDKVMSDDSLNPVSNKVVKAYVDKIKSDIDMLVGGNLSSAIDNFNEILEFLSSIEDSETLSGIIAGLETALKKYADGVAQTAYEQSYADAVGASSAYTDGRIAALAAVARTGSYNDLKDKPTIPDVSGKQDKLVSGQNIKTINGQSILGSGNIEIQGGGGATPKVEMTAASAAIEPNKFYVWPMMDSLDLTLGSEQSGVMNRYLFQFRNPKAGVTILSLPDDITWSEDTELDENGLPVMEAAAFYRIEIIEGLASLKKWKLVYINFADAEVERVLMANGVGDGIGITKRDAAAVVSFGRWFRENKNVVSFEELKYFTNVKELYEETFWHCESLSLDMTGKLKSVEYIGNGSFSNTKAKGAVAFPNLKQVLGIWQNEGLFMNTDIEEVLDLGSVQSLIEGYNEAYPGCFGKCAKLRKVVLPDTYRTIGSYEFHGCTSLTELMGLGGVNYIGQCAFSGCSSLNVDLTGMLGNVEKLATGAFANTKAKGSLSMPNLKQHIGSVWGNATFLNTDIEEVLDLGSVASFVDGYNGNFPGCFGKCKSLRRVVLPSTLTNTGAYTFWQCSALEVVVCHAVTPPTLGAYCFGETNDTFIIYVPDVSVEAYKAATNWNAYASRIKGISEYTG